MDADVWDGHTSAAQASTTCCYQTALGSYLESAPYLSGDSEPHDLSTLNLRAAFNKIKNKMKADI